MLKYFNYSGRIISCLNKNINIILQARYYSTKFEPPKKEKKTKVELSANIKKFLARKAEEEKKKADVERKRKDELLALRSQVKIQFLNEFPCCSLKNNMTNDTE